MDRRSPDPEQVRRYRKDGYLIVPGLFGPQELEPLQQAYEEDPTVNGSMYGMADYAGELHPICIWTECGEDVIGMIPRIARMVDTAEALLGEECYHWHSKITVKPPHCLAKINWHQDFGSWYDDGVMFPHMLTVAVAVQPATRENGCMQLVPGSHRLGRIDHRPRKGEPDTFPARVAKAKELMGLVHCELDVGDAVFFDCNVLHGSGSNKSDTSRLMIFSSYNAVSNPPIPGGQGANEEGAFMDIAESEREYSPMDKVPDDCLSARRYKSVFHDTPFKRLRSDLGGTYTKAYQL